MRRCGEKGGEGGFDEGCEGGEGGVDMGGVVVSMPLSSKCAGTHTRHQPGAGACSEGYEYGASRPAAGGIRERMDIWGKDVT